MGVEYLSFDFRVFGHAPGYDASQTKKS